jgi:Zn-dependent peptidase ImmA (M78 family)
MTNQRIEQQACMLLAKYSIARAPVPVEQIAVDEGAQVVRSPSSGQESGFLLRDGHRTLIGLNSRDTDRRQRFTIAHELGHLHLHKGRPLIVDHSVRVNRRNDVSSAATDREEIDANAFAAALLMPEKFIMEAVHRHLDRGIVTQDELTQQLANEFEVSAQAMSWRLINLNIYN